MRTSSRIASVCLALVILAGLGLAACGQPTATPTPASASVGYPEPGQGGSAGQDPGYPGPSLPVTELPTTAEPPTTAPEPTAGQASMAGVLFSYRINRALPGTQVFITRAVGPEQRSLPGLITGPEPSIGDLYTFSDDKGQFAFNNVAPGNYFMFVEAPLAWVPAQLDPNNAEPQLIELKADERRLLGVLTVAWP
ncbi:MAG: hypothetical protein JNK29_10215 [Anaerolineales bacterium]|nr:hypothetical protein [Anaerolineales bacterium]